MLKMLREPTTTVRSRSVLLVDPFWRRFDLSGGFVAGVFAATAFEAAGGSNGHVVIAINLAAETDAAQAAGLEHITFGDRHFIRLAGNEFDAAGCAAGVTTARVKLIDACVLRESKDQTFAGGYFKFADAFDC